MQQYNVLFTNTSTSANISATTSKSESRITLRSTTTSTTPNEFTVMMEVANDNDFQFIQNNQNKMYTSKRCDKK